MTTLYKEDYQQDASVKPLVRSNIQAACHGRPNRSWNEGDALSQDNLLSLALYSPFHPAAKRLNEMMDVLKPEVPIRVHINRSDYENAFALPSGDIVVDDSLLRKLSGEGATEKVYALLQHELTHVENGDALSRFLDRSMTVARTHEFRADLSEATELSKHGINPMGAILLQHSLEKTPSLGGQTKVEEERRGIPVEVSPIHGSSAERVTTLEEMTRFRDLPHLSREVGFEDFRALLESSPRSVDRESLIDLPMREFWPACTSVGSKDTLRVIVIQRIGELSIGVPEEELESLAILLFPRLQDPQREEVPRQPLSIASWSALLEDGAFETLGRIPPNSRLLEHLKSAIQIAIRDGEEPKSLELLRGKIIHFIERTALHPKRDILGLDTNLMHSIIKEKSDILGFQWETDDESAIRITDGAKVSLDVEELARYAEAIGIGTVDFSSIWIEMMEEIGAGEMWNHIDDKFRRSEPGSLVHDEATTGSTIDQGKTPDGDQEDEWWNERDDGPELEAETAGLDAQPEVPIENFDEDRDEASRERSLPDFAPGSELVFGNAIQSLAVGLDELQKKLSRDNTGSEFESKLLAFERLLDSYVAGVPIYRFIPLTLGEIKWDTSEEMPLGQYEAQLDRAAYPIFKYFRKTISQLSAESAAIDVINIYAAKIVDESRSNVERFQRLTKLGALLKKVHYRSHIESEDSSGSPLQDAPLEENSLQDRYEEMAFFATIHALADGRAHSHSQKLSRWFEEDLVRLRENSTDESEKFSYGDAEYLGALLRWQIYVVDSANQVLENLYGVTGLREQERARIVPVSVTAKREALARMSNLDLHGDALLKHARSTIRQWPIVWTSVDGAEYTQTWRSIESKVEALLAKDPLYPRTIEQCEELLCLSLLEQGSFGSGIVASRLLCKMVREAPSTSAAIGYLERYEFLPPTVLKEPVELLLSERARSPREIRRIGDLVRRHFNEHDLGEILLGAHMAEIVAQLGLRGEERIPLFLGLVTKNNDDNKLRELVAPIWWRSQPEEVKHTAIRDVAGLAILAERKVPKDYSDPNLIAAAKSAQSLSRERFPVTYMPFDDTMRQLHQAGPIFNYLLLQQLALRGRGKTGDSVRRNIIDKYPVTHNQILSGIEETAPLFDSPGIREEIFSGICAHYVMGESQSVLETPAVRAIVHALSFGPSSDKLYHFTGPLLAHLASLMPKETGKFETLPQGVEEQVDDFLRRTYSDLVYPFRGQDFTLTVKLSHARALGILTGIPPTLTWDRTSKVLGIQMDRAPEVATINRMILDRLPAPSPGRTLPGNLTVIDLAIMVGEHHHAIGRRMLQLLALIRGNEMSDEDRAKIYRSFDRSPGMNKMQVMEIVDTESERSTRLNALVENISEIPPIEHGGSIFTVPKVVLLDGSVIALHVENTNAGFLAGEVAEFYRSLIDALPEDELAERDKSLTYALLDSAIEWTLAEVADPNYFENFRAFRSRNDWREVAAGNEGYRAGQGKCRFVVPEIADTGTLKVRWQEWWSGTTLAELEEGIETNDEQKTISSHDLREVSAHIVQNFLHQLLEDGLFHSNVHPGNYAVRSLPEGRLEVAIFDTKNLIRITTDEQTQIVRALKLYQGGQEIKAAEILISLVLPESRLQAGDLVEQLKAEFAVRPPRGLEDGFSSVLTLLSDQGERVPLKWMLLAQNFLGCKNLLDRAGISGGISEAFFWTSPDEEQKSPLEVVREIYPHTFQTLKNEIGLAGLLKSFLSAGLKRKR